MRSTSMLRIGLLTNLLLTLGAMLMAYRFAERSDLATRDVIRSHQTISTAQEVLRRVVDAQAGTRGYLLTHDDAELLPFQRAIETTPSLLTALTALVEGHDEQRTRAERLRAQVSGLLEALRALVESEKAGGPATDLRKAERDQLAVVRQTIRELLPTENAQLDARVEVDAAAGRTVTWMVILMTGLAVALVTANGMLMLFIARPGVWLKPGG